MKILVGVATYQRPKKLERLINSLYQQTYTNFDIFIVFDNNDYISAEYVHSKFPKVNIKVLEGNNYVIGCWNLIHKIKGYDAHLTLVDDVELYPNTIEETVKAMKTNFPDLDGVIGLSQECPGHPEYTSKVSFGQTMVGKTFLERYKEVDYKFCCTAYSHFYQDEEMYMFANSLNKFVHSKEAILKHFHPAFLPNEMDSTHLIVRGKIIKEDTIIFNKRKQKGLIWGKSWGLL